MVAVWLGERSIRALLNTTVVLLIGFLRALLRASGELIFLICDLAVVLREGQEGFLQASACHFQPTNRRILIQQLANHRFGLAGVDLHGVAIFANFGDAGNAAQRVQRKTGNAADALAAGFGLYFGWSSLCDNRALIDDRDAVGERVVLI